MKWGLFLLPPAVVLGLLIGGWAPREEARALRKELEEARRQTEGRERGMRIDSITRMIKIPDRAQPRPKPETAAQPEAEGNPSITVQAEERRPYAVQPKPEEIAAEEDAAREATPEDLRARIEEAKALWLMRVETARAQWIDRLGLTEEGTELFDASINAMNESLYETMQGFADRLAAGEELTPELGVRLASELTGTLAQTYDEMASFLPEESQGDMAQIELTDFIDPAVAEPLIAVEGKLEGARPARRRGGWGRRNAP